MNLSKQCLFSMADSKIACAIILITIMKTSTCYDNTSNQNVEERNNTDEQRYPVNNLYWERNIQNLGQILYPRGDKKKLILIASLWNEYYECCRRLLDTVTNHRQLPLVNEMVYVGAVARLPCLLCVAPNEIGQLKWVYSESLNNMTFSLIKDDERMVAANGNLMIYNVKMKDAGAYRCQIGASRSITVLEVIDDHDYDVVKPATSRGPYSTPPENLTNGLTVFSNWSPWSECSACGRVGRRRRYGLCYVKLDLTPTNNTNVTTSNLDKTDIILNEQEMDLFEVFPGGIPCRSKYLPSRLRIPPIIDRRSEIMIAMCKESCNNFIFIARLPNGDITEVANNSAGIYSLRQTLPKQPPTPIRDTVFVDFGHSVHITCPGTTLRDVPITWRMGTKVIVPKQLDKTSGGRAYLNSRDRLVIAKVLYRDVNLYSCWQRERLAGSVTLAVRAGVLARRVLLLALLLPSLLLLRAARRARRRLQH